MVLNGSDLKSAVCEVAITRARFRLWVIGDLQTLANDEMPLSCPDQWVASFLNRFLEGGPFKGNNQTQERRFQPHFHVREWGLRRSGPGIQNEDFEWPAGQRQVYRVYINTCFLHPFSPWLTLVRRKSSPPTCSCWCGSGILVHKKVHLCLKRGHCKSFAFDSLCNVWNGCGRWSYVCVAWFARFPLQLCTPRMGPCAPSPCCPGSHGSRITGRRSYMWVWLKLKELGLRRF